MTPDELAALLERATPGPWSQGMIGDRLITEVDSSAAFGFITVDERLTDDGNKGLNDAALVVELRNLAPLLVDLWQADMLDNRYARSKARTAALRALAEHTVEGTP